MCVLCALTCRMRVFAGVAAAVIATVVAVVVVVARNAESAHGMYTHFVPSFRVPFRAPSKEQAHTHKRSHTH